MNTSTYYIATRPQTVVSILQTGYLPKKLPDFIEPKQITIFENPSECVAKIKRLFDQVFVLQLRLPLSIDSDEFSIGYALELDKRTLTHIEITWVQKVLVHSEVAHKLLLQLFKGHLPKPVEIMPEIYISIIEKDRIYLEVPFSEKEEARFSGARWDPHRRQWFVPPDRTDLISRWPVTATPITHLVGEDRNFSGYRNFLDVPYEERSLAKSMGAFWDPVLKKWYAPLGREELMDVWPLRNPVFLKNYLFVDLIPSTCWFTNVRSSVHPSDWDRLRKYIYERAQWSCECCSKTNCALDAHERWHFNLHTRRQKLMRLIALCKDCHETTHMGLAIKRGRGEAATMHLRHVIGMNAEQAEQHIEEAFALGDLRNQFLWELDLSIITDTGIRLEENPKGFERAQIAQQESLKRKREEEVLEELLSKRQRAEFFQEMVLEEDPSPAYPEVVPTWPESFSIWPSCIIL